MSRTYLQRLVLASALTLGVTTAHAAEASQSDLVAALPKSKLTLAEGMRQAAKPGEAVISAKFEFDDNGKLSLSVYTAEKGLSVDSEKNVLKELSGSPEQTPWKPDVEIFKDVPHVARSAEQLTLMSLTSVALLDVVAKAQKTYPNGKVFSITPEIKQRRAVAVVLVTNNGKVFEMSYKLLDGTLVEKRQH